MSDKGFSTKEGLLAIGGLVGAVLVAIWGLGKRWKVSLVFLGLISLFFGIYGKKLCITCEKWCPCNSNLAFWKRALKELQTFF